MSVSLVTMLDHSETGAPQRVGRTSRRMPSTPGCWCCFCAVGRTDGAVRRPGRPAHASGARSWRLRRSSRRPRCDGPSGRPVTAINAAWPVGWGSVDTVNRDVACRVRAVRSVSARRRSSWAAPRRVQPAACPPVTRRIRPALSCVNRAGPSTRRGTPRTGEPPDDRGAGLASSPRTDPHIRITMGEKSEIVEAR
jgi:hypothetical protein